MEQRFNPVPIQYDKTDASGNPWHVIRFPGGYTIATGLCKITVSSGGFTSSGSLYQYRTAPIHHGIAFTEIYSQHVTNVMAEPGTGEPNPGLAWTMTNRRENYLPADHADPNEYTHSVNLFRPSNTTAQFKFTLNFLIIGRT